MRFDKLKRLVDPSRPITYGIVQAGPEYDDGVPYIRPADMTDEGGVKDFSSIKRTSPEIAQQYRRSSVVTGDLVVSIGPSFGKVMEVPVQLNGANLTQGTARVAPGGNLNTRFAFWCLRSGHCYAQWEASIGGATFRALNLGPLAETRIPLPNLSTQRAIADFLDRETARIDTLIEKKQRLVELLGEKRSATITSTVVGGGDYGSASRGGGLSYWPRDMKFPLMPIKFCASVNPDILGETTNPDFEFDYIDIGSVTLADGVTQKQRMKFESAPSRARKLVRASDVIVSTVRTYLRAIAAVEHSEVPQVASTGFAVFRANSRLDQRFLYRAVQATPFVEQVVSQSVGVSYPAINPSTLADIEIPLPDLPTQRAIADFLDRETARIDTLGKKISASVDRLKEYRSALITSAVTGQIDVTKWTNAGTTDRQLDAIEAEFGA